MRSSWPALGWRLRPFFQVLWKRVPLKFDPDLGLQDQVDLHGSLWEALEFLSVILGEIIFRRNHKNSRAFLSLLLAVIVACTFMKYILTRELQEEEQETASMLSFLLIYCVNFMWNCSLPVLKQVLLNLSECAESQYDHHPGGGDAL